MSQNSYLFTSESVTEGHPDKMADQISDAVLDFIIEKDPKARVACETLLATGLCVVAGELKTSVNPPIQDIVRSVVREIGYEDAKMGFDANSCAVLNCLGKQSPEITQGVDRSDGEIGAGDQGLMFGYACTETEDLMPLPIWLSHQITQGLAKNRHDKTMPFLRPDGKSQVTVHYENGKPTKIDTIVVSTQHNPEIKYEDLKHAIIEDVVKKVIPAQYLDDHIKYHINPTGSFVLGGPQGDSGLTGRKIIVDTYGGSCPHGGGAFSGKDPSKVDRSAAYMARYIAKNLVASGVCEKATVQLAYAIGVVEPVSIFVDTNGTSKVGEDKITQCIREIFSLTPSGIIKSLDLLKPIYRKTAAYGHFGRCGSLFSWEKTDKVQAIKDYLKF